MSSEKRAMSRGRYGVVYDELCTVWKVTGLPNWPSEVDVRLVLSTTGEAAVDAIEQAAAANGVKIKRVDEQTRGNLPVQSSYEEVAALLLDMAERVKAGDSMEGSIEYLIPIPPDESEDADVMVRAAYRIGNTMGQGGMRIIGTVGRPQ